MEVESQMQLVIYSSFTMCLTTSAKIVTALKNQMVLTVTLMQLPSITETWPRLFNMQNTSLCFPLLAGKFLPSLQGRLIMMPMQMLLLSHKKPALPNFSLQTKQAKPVRNIKRKLHFITNTQFNKCLI